MSSPRHRDARVARVIDFFERFQASDVARLGQVYTADACFKDPFNEVRGLAAIEGVFAHMCRSLDAPRFVIRDAVAAGDTAFLSWDFLFRMKRFDRTERVVRGASQLTFAPDGRIAVHRDYWDAAEELYEKLPAVGALMRWLKRRASS